MVVYSAVRVLLPSHHHLVSLHAAGVGNDGIWLVFNTDGPWCLIPVPTAVEVRVQREEGRGGGVPVSLYPFAPQVHKCPSQATRVHNLTSTTPLLMTNSALSVVDFECVLSRRESVLIY